MPSTCGRRSIRSRERGMVRSFRFECEVWVFRRFAHATARDWSAAAAGTETPTSAPDTDRCLAPAALLDAGTEQGDVGAGREVAQAAAQDDGPAGGLMCSSHFGRDRTDQGRPEQIVRPVLHRKDRDQPSFLAPDYDIVIHEYP